MLEMSLYNVVLAWLVVSSWHELAVVVSMHLARAC